MVDEHEPVPKKKARINLQVVLGYSNKWRMCNFAQYSGVLGSDFLVADLDENAIRKESPEGTALAVANAKADALLPSLKGRSVLLACTDQVVCCGDLLREKPIDEAEARAFLESYRAGNGATCINSIVVHNTQTGKRVQCVDRSTIFWRFFPDSVIDHLISKGDIFNSAGALTIDDPELKVYQARLDGTIDSIEGLPIARLISCFNLAGAPAVTHVVFDMDGLLLDTETAISVAAQRVLERFGKVFTWETKVKILGKPALEACRAIIEDLEMQGMITPDEFLEESQKILDKLLVECELMPGAERLVRHLHKYKVPMAVATSSYRPFFDIKTTRHGDLFGLMHHIVTGDQVSKSKPDPQIFLEAAQRFEGGPIDPEHILVFEDAPNGVAAARAAGMQVCHVPDPDLPYQSRGQSHCELRSLEEFRPEDWGLPPFQ